MTPEEKNWVSRVDLLTEHLDLALADLKQGPDSEALANLILAKNLVGAMCKAHKALLASLKRPKTEALEESTKGKRPPLSAEEKNWMETGAQLSMYLEAVLIDMKQGPDSETLAHLILAKNHLLYLHEAHNQEIGRAHV